MVEAAHATPPPASAPPAWIPARHTCSLIVVLYALAFLWGARNGYAAVPSHVDILLSVALAWASSAWVIADARHRESPIPLLARPWLFLAFGIAVPGYVVWTRRWRGLGWLVAHAILWFLVSAVVMLVVGVIVHIV